MSVEDVLVGGEERKGLKKDENIRFKGFKNRSRKRKGRYRKGDRFDMSWCVKTAILHLELN